MQFVRYIWRLIELTKPPKAVLIGAIAFTALASIFQMIGLGLIIPLLNGLVDPNEYEALLNNQTIAVAISFLPIEPSNKVIFISIIVLVLVAAYLENILLFFGQTLSARLTTEIAHQLRIKSFQRCLKFSKSFYDGANLGELNLLLTNLIVRVGQSIHDASRLLIVSSFTMAFFAMMIIISWRLTLCAVVLLPITNLVSTTIARKIQRSSESEVESLVELSEHSLDVLNNIEITQLAGQEESELSRLRASSDQIRSHGYNSRKKQFAVPRIVDMINSTGIILLVCIAVFLFLAVESSSIGRLSIFFISLRRFTSHSEQLASAWGQAVSGIPQIKKVLWIFQNSDKSFISTGTEDFPKAIADLEFENVSFTYANNRTVIDDVSFTADVGTMTAVVGPTGSGKTTLMNLIPRFYDINSGAVRINGIELNQLDIVQLRSKIAVVSQNSHLFKSSIRENLTYGLSGDVNESKILAALDEAHALDFVSNLSAGINTRLGENGLRLSGGEKQRLSIARAILRNPDILILDEATSALDAETELAVAQAIDRMVEGRIVFVVAHRLSTIRRADQIIVLEDGRVTESGSSEELLSERGKFFEYCEIQGIFI